MLVVSSTTVVKVRLKPDEQEMPEVQLKRVSKLEQMSLALSEIRGLTKCAKPGSKLQNFGLVVKNAGKPSSVEVRESKRSSIIHVFDDVRSRDGSDDLSAIFCETLHSTIAFI